MVSALSKRTCPYCGSRIILGRCPVVATNFDTIHHDTGFYEADDDAGPRSSYGRDASGTRRPSSGHRAASQASRRSRPVSGARVYGSIGGSGNGDHCPIVEMPSLAVRDGSVLGVAKDVFRAVGSCFLLPSVWQSADPQDLPARACTNCGNPLPVDIDDRRIITIAVLGTTSAGKTHYLASAMYQACRQQGLKAVGCEQFEPDEGTAKIYHEKYFEPLFVNGERLQSTNFDPLISFRPLVYRVKFRDSVPCSVLFHDISGEMLYDQKARARYAQFINRADGAIFLIDPDQLMMKFGINSLARGNSSATYNQADLLNGWLERIPAHIPVALTLSKSDIVTSMFPEKHHGFKLTYPDNGMTWSRQMAEIDKDVKDLLGRLDAYDLVAAGNRRGDQVSFHAVTALGGSPENDRVERVVPQRCLDPLVTVLTRIPEVIGSAAR